MLLRSLFISSLLKIAIVSSLKEQRLHNLLYRDVPVDGFCFRRANGTHQFGCSSNFNGNIGTVHLIRDSGQSDMDYVLSRGSDPPYMVVMRADSFTWVNIVSMSESVSGRVAGVLLLLGESFNSSKVHHPFSEDSVCPNQYSSLNGTCDSNTPWNPYGFDAAKLGSSSMSFPFPIFVSRDANMTEFIVKQCFERYNAAVFDSANGGSNSTFLIPRCVLEMKAHMYASQNSETCVRRSQPSAVGVLYSQSRYCDELGDFNIFDTLFEDRSDSVSTINASTKPVATNDRHQYILVSTHIDSRTSFDLKNHGSDTPVTHLVALLEIARILHKAKAEVTKTKIVDNVIFAFFHGETYDYIGSSRTVYDMKNGRFKLPSLNGQSSIPINVSDINTIIDLGQLFNEKSLGKVYIHTDSQHNSETNRGKVNKLLSEGKSAKLDVAESKSSNLPVSSIHSFLKVNRSIDALHISDFDETFTNQFYHSTFDGENVADYNYTRGSNQTIVTHLSKVVEMVSKFVFKQTFGDDVAFPSDVQSNSTLINELLHCYLQSANCSTFHAASSPHTPPNYGGSDLPHKRPFSQYVSVSQKTTYHTIFTRNVLALLTSHGVNETATTPEQCTNENNHTIFLKGFEVPSYWKDKNESCASGAECGWCFKTSVFLHSATSPAFLTDNQPYDFKSNEYPTWTESVWQATSVRVFLVHSCTTDVSLFVTSLVVLAISLLSVYFFDKRFLSKISNTSCEETTGVMASVHSVPVQET